MHKNKWWSIMKPLVTNLAILILLSTFFLSSSLAGGVEPFPGLQKAVQDIRSQYKGEDLSLLAEKEYQVRKYYYEIQSKMQKMEILEEVKEHFEKAVTKAKEKYDSGEEEISQSSITKLKLGLAGTLNDIIELDSEITVARLSLADMFNENYSVDAAIHDSVIIPIGFKFNDYETWFKESGLTVVTKKINNQLGLKVGYLKAVENRGKLQLAQKNRKITRALLVSEAANYDFGIGDPGDLFEALIIYTRVLGGYYDAVYNFNVSVANLNRVKAPWTGNP
jgi:hypothetical protein